MVNASQHSLNLQLLQPLLRCTCRLQGASDRYTCHTFTIPDSIPDHREFVAVRAALGGGSHLHHVLLMECPADLWFLQDVTRSTEACMLNSGGLYAACNRW